MKRSERHHLKENTLATWLLDLQELLETRRRTVMILALLTVGLLIAAGGYLSYQRSLAARGTDLLADALNTATAPVVPPTPPPDPDNPTAPRPAPAFQPGSYTSASRRAEAALEKFLSAADAYPDSPAGITARYHAATTLGVLGRRDEAEAQYRQVVELASDHIYGTMARLGLAETQMYAGKHAAAIELFEAELSGGNPRVPIDGVLMQLGRAYLLADRTAKAQESFARVVDEFPESVYGPAAQEELDKLERPSEG